MEEGKGKGGEISPQLLDLIPNGSNWLLRDSRKAAEEKKLELTLSLPGCVEDWFAVKEKREEPESSALRLCHFSRISKTEGFQQQQQGPMKRKAGCPPPLCAAAAAPVSANAAGTNTRAAAVPVVGWPPLRALRKNLASSSSKPALESQKVASKAEVKVENCKKRLFIKINMDGIPIGRKVDLMAYDSYEKLSSAVEDLFLGLLAAQRDIPPAKILEHSEEKRAFTGLLDGRGDYTLVYEDSEGDRMLVGDIPWDMFVSKAKRLRVLKTAELPALSSKAIGGKRTAER